MEKVDMRNLTEKPARLQEKIFSQIFDETDLKRMSDDEYQMYEESLKHYRDLKNSLDTAFDEGKIEGKIETAAVMKKDGIPVETISKYTGLSKDEIDHDWPPVLVKLSNDEVKKKYGN